MLFRAVRAEAGGEPVPPRPSGPGALAPDVAFEVPAALVEGLDEVREAFRAVRAFAPSADAPAEAQIDARRYVVRTAVRYALPLTGPDGLVVRSDVLVTLAERDGKIERLEERWSGARLLEGFPFDMVRRGVSSRAISFSPIVTAVTRARDVRGAAVARHSLDAVAREAQQDVDPTRRSRGFAGPASSLPSFPSPPVSAHE